MKHFTVTGMSCAACSARVEKAVGKLDGVTECSVSLLTNSMTVEGSASVDDIVKAVKNAGYGAYEKGSNGEVGKDESADSDASVLKRKLILSLGFLIVLMYFSMGHTMLSLPLPRLFEDNPIYIASTQMVLAAIIIIINRKFYINGVRGLVNKAPNMDTLVSLGSFAAFLYSLTSLFAMIHSAKLGDADAVNSLLHDLYFESSAMILVLITVGKLLEAVSKGKTTDALKSLIDLTPKTATVLYGGEEKTVPVSEIKKDDVFIVKSGEAIPADGVVIDGGCTVDESSLTGESIPVDKEINDSVCSGTMNISGYIKCKAVSVGEDTVLSQIIKTVSDAAATKAPIAKIADKVSGIFVPTVIFISAITTFIWLFLDKEIGFALSRGISVLVVSCPCALGLATPVAIMVGSGVGAKNGILFKNATSLEQAGKTNIVVLDKTGTVTSGVPQVTDVITFDGFSEKELLQLAVSLEIKSEHPLARAIVSYAQKNGISPYESTDFEAFFGSGVKCTVNKTVLYGGNLSFISKKAQVDEKTENTARILSQNGKTPIFFVSDDQIVGIIALADVIKDDSPRAVQELKKMGIDVVMLTGDNEVTAAVIAEKAGISNVVAGVLPTEKESEIIKLKQRGRVMMVGDGINDAPALMRADLGVAIGSGTDIAIDSADVVLMKSRLSDIPALIRLSRRTLKTIHQNLFWAFIYNIIGIPLAAGAFIALLGWEMNPMFGAAAMSVSSFIVVTNALRINLFKIYDPSKDKKKKSQAVESSDSLTKVLKVKGMMCGHCEARVKDALLKLDEVKSAEADYKSGTVYITLRSACDDEKLKETIINAGYKVK